MTKTQDEETKKVQLHGDRPPSKTLPRPSTGRVQLVVLAGNKIGQTFPVHESTLLGRSEEAGVQIDDPEISRRHAIVRSTGPDVYEIEDLASRNGTLVNGVKIERASLRLGDRIQLGSRVVLQLVRHEPVEDMLRHQQRLEMLGRLCAGVAHDLNNMLAVIVTNLECLDLELREGGTPSEGVAECLDDLRTAAAHASKLTPRLLSFGRADERNMARLDLSRVCEELVPVLRRTVPRSIVVESDIQPALQVLGIAADLQQVLMNLCLNSRDAMPAGGTLRIETRLEAASVEGKGRCALVRVTDSGEGMSDEVRVRIFEPFFTTKKRGAGSGLGLATVHDIVTAHGGEIEVSTAVGQGSTFTIRFPTVDPSGHPTATAMRAAAGRAASPALTVMLVCEEAIVRRGLRRLLSRHGYRVTEAPDAATALARYTESRPDLLLLDTDTTGADRAFLSQLRELDHQVKVLLYVDPSQGADESARHPSVRGSVRRPASPLVLLDEVNRILASPRSVEPG